MTMMRNSPFRTFVVVLEEPRRLQVMIGSDLSPDCQCRYQTFHRSKFNLNLDQCRYQPFNSLNFNLDQHCYQSFNRLNLNSDQSCYRSFTWLPVSLPTFLLFKFKIKFGSASLPTFLLFKFKSKFGSASLTTFLLFKF